MNSEFIKSSEIIIKPSSASYFDSTVKKKWFELIQLVLNIQPNIKIEIISKTIRTWTPMDRVLPPNCPFTDITIRKYKYNDISIITELEFNKWNERELSNASYSYKLHKNDKLLFFFGIYSNSKPFKIQTLTINSKIHQKEIINSIAREIKKLIEI